MASGETPIRKQSANSGKENSIKIFATKFMVQEAKFFSDKSGWDPTQKMLLLFLLKIALSKMLVYKLRLA